MQDNNPIPEIRPSWIGWFILIAIVLAMLAQIGTLLMAYEASGVINGKRSEIVEEK